MRLRLRTKLTAAYLIPVLAVLAVAGTMAFRAARNALVDGLGRQLSAVARTVGAQLTTTRDAGRICRLAENPDPESSQRIRLNGMLTELANAAEMRRVFVFAPDLSAILDTDPTVEPGSALFDLEPDRAEIERVVSAGAGGVSSILFADDEGTRFMNGYAAVVHEGEVCAVVGVAGSAATFGILDALRAALVIVGTVVVLMVFLASFFVSHRLTRHIDDLVKAIRRYGRGEQKEPVVVTARDEIGYLADAFNDMRESLDRRDEQMQLMLSGIAHEVRNPLAGMELFCSLLRNELADDSEQAEYVDKIARELDYLGRVVRDFLNYARKRPLSPERFPADPMVLEVIQGVQSAAELREITVSADIDPELELTGEREAIRGVLTNLVRNAVQACEPGGRVTIVARGTDSKRTIQVIDDGAGIDPVKQKKIFEPFFTTRQQGTGLGLALVHKTIRDHGGRIDVESAIGEGTKFEVELPFDDRLRSLQHEPDFVGADDEIEMIG